MTDSVKFTKHLPLDLVAFGDPNPITGAMISRFIEQYEITLIEACASFGVNTASLYQKKGNDSVSPTLSILLRLYAAFPDELYRIKVISPDELAKKIKAIDPEFRPTHIGPLLGMRANSGFRVRNNGLEGSSLQVRMLALLIDKLITQDKNNWFAIKAAIEIEAQANGITPPSEVWNGKGSKAKKPAKQTAAKAKATPGNESGQSEQSTSKGVIRRRKPTDQ